MALAFCRQYPWELLSIPRGGKKPKQKKRQKFTCREFGNGFPASWSVVNEVWFHWPCKCINSRFPYSGRFLRSIHYLLQALALLSLTETLVSEGIVQTVFLMGPVQEGEEHHCWASLRRNKGSFELTTSLHGQENMRSYFFPNKGQEREIISEENWKSVIVKMSLASCLWCGNCTAFLP